LNQIVSDSLSCQNQIDSFFENQRIALLLRQSNILKQCGIAPVAVMRFIFCLALTGKNLFRYLQTADSSAEIGKDTVYRFLNSTHANWRKFLHLLSAAVIRKHILPLKAEQTPKASRLWPKSSSSEIAAKRNLISNARRVAASCHRVTCCLPPNSLRLLSQPG
jgi:hypothetical protein